MPGSKPPLVSRPPCRGVLAARRVPVFGFPSICAGPISRRPLDSPPPRFAPRPAAPRGVWVAETRSVCAPLRFSFPRSTSRNVYVKNSSTWRALRRGSPVNVAGCHEGEESSCCHPSTWGVSMSAPGVDVARGHRGAGFPCRSDTEDLGAGGWTRSALPLLLDARSVWAVKVGAAFCIYNQQISARFDVTFQCQN